MNTYSHEYARLYHRGLRGFERHDARMERRYFLFAAATVLAGLVYALFDSGVLP